MRKTSNLGSLEGRGSKISRGGMYTMGDGRWEVGWKVKRERGFHEERGNLKESSRAGMEGIQQQH